MTATVDESAEYRDFLTRRGLSQYAERDPIVAMMRQLWDLDERIDRAAEQVEAAHDRVSRARAERTLDRLERQHAALYERIDEYAPYADVQLAVYAESLHRPNRHRPTPASSGFSPVPTHSTEEDS